MKTLLSIIVLLYFNYSFACSCRDLDELSIRDYQASDVIFLGKVIQIRENTTIQELDYRNKEMIFEVIEYYKGIPKAQKTITVYTSFWSASCGLPVREAGEIWFLFANSDTNNFLFTSVCSYSRKIHEPENEFSMKLRQYSSAEGYTVFYNNDNTISAEGKIVNNLPEGAWKYYIRNGEIYETGSYLNGQKDSLWIKYSHNDLIVSVTSYKNGKQNGKSVSYHYKTDILKTVEFYIDDKQDGEMLRYYKSGNLMIKGRFKDGKPSGEWTAYSESGEVKCTAVNTRIVVYDEIMGKFSCESK